jgi:hypothetical protein
MECIYSSINFLFCLKTTPRTMHNPHKTVTQKITNTSKTIITPQNTIRKIPTKKNINHMFDPQPTSNIKRMIHAEDAAYFYHNTHSHPKNNCDVEFNKLVYNFEKSNIHHTNGKSIQRNASIL